MFEASSASTTMLRSTRPSGPDPIAPIQNVAVVCGVTNPSPAVSGTRRGSRSSGSAPRATTNALRRRTADVARIGPDNFRDHEHVWLTDSRDGPERPPRPARAPAGGYPGGLRGAEPLSRSSIGRARAGRRPIGRTSKGRPPPSTACARGAAEGGHCQRQQGTRKALNPAQLQPGEALSWTSTAQFAVLSAGLSPRCQSRVIGACKAVKGH